MGVIPDGAKQTYKGVRFEIYQWQQKMFDGSHQTYEAIKRADSAEALVVVGDRLLIQEESQPHIAKPFLSFPGGCVDAGETSEQAIRREVLEETGYEAQEWELMHSVDPLQSAQWTMHVFIGRGARKVREPHLDVGERIATRLVTFEELIDLVDSGAMYRFEATLRLMLVRAKYDAASREALRQRIFGESLHNASGGG